MDASPSPPRPWGRFPTTRWSTILRAREGPDEHRAALEEILSAYWKPMFIYLRRKGHAREDAEDAVQGFCAQLLERDFLDTLAPEKGKFRSYLRAGLDHYLANLHHHRAALKRGGEVRMVPIDLVLAERDLAAAPELPSLAFDREWALALMERALARLRDEYATGARRERADALFQFFQMAAPPTYAEAAAACGLTVTRFKVALHRARARLRDLLREEVAATVDDDADVEAEMSELRALLSP